MSARTLEKRCSCRGTASGPRVVVRQKDSDLTADAFTFVATLVEMACDECDTPWTPAARAPGGEGHSE